MVARRLLSHLNDNNLLPSFIAFGFRSGHSTDTAVRHVLSDILAVDRGEFAALAHLEISMISDTVDHHILQERLQRSIGIMGIAHRCSYLTHGSLCVFVAVPQNLS